MQRRFVLGDETPVQSSVVEPRGGGRHRPHDQRALPVRLGDGGLFLHSPVDLEVDLVYERWSVLEEYRIGFNGKLKAFNRLEKLEDVVLPKRWEDTFAIRVGSNFTPLGSWLVFRTGAHYETAAAPEETTNIDFLGFDRLGGSVGAGLALGPLTVDVAYQLVYQPDREVTNSEVVIQRPLDPDVDLPIATGNGTYKSTYHNIGVSLGYTWGAPDEDEEEESDDEDEDEDE